MTEFIYKDYLPANARVIVDYTKEQKVSFSYPIEWTYWKAVWKRGFTTVMSFWWALHFCIFIYLRALIFIIFLGFLIFLTFHPISTTTETNYTFLNYVLPIICVVFYLLGIPALITLWLALDKERMSNWFPKLGYWSAKLTDGTREKTFTKEDVADNKVIIPSFSNVFLNYKTSGDFDKYLEKIEIMEIPFSYKTRRFWLPYLSKKEKNDYDFRAVFFFSQTPIEGGLEVEFI